ncbi:hypothetical protein BJ138DRAFT_1108176, partial [Hygrophoropsis aurantiaca]
MSNCFYQLPDLLAICPSKSMPPNIHAKAPEIQRHKNCGRRCSISWNLIACKNAKATIAVSFCFPKGDAKAFKAVVAFAKASGMLERLTDTATVVDARKWATLYINAFDHVIQGTKAQRSFVSLAASVNEGLGDLHRKDFLDANSAFAQGIVQEAVDRQEAQDANAKLTVDVYLATRRDTIAVKPAIVLVRSAGGLNRCSRLLDDPSVRGMEEATSDLVIIANDIYSYKKELVDDNGASHNLLT